MNDREPVKRLLVDDGATALERDLLGAGARMKAPADLEGRVWGALGTRLASTGAGAAGAALAAKSATEASAAGGALKAGAAAALKTKLLVAAFVVAGAGTTATIVATQPPPVRAATLATPPSAPAPALVKVKSEARTIAAHRLAPVVAATSPNEMPSAAPAPEASAAPAPRARVATAAKIVETTKSIDTAPPPEAAAPSAPAQTALRGDALAIRQARAALQTGDVAGAEQSLATLSRGTMLAPERDALRVRIAAARGDDARAAQLADAFLRTYPDSPLAPQVARHASK